MQFWNWKMIVNTECIVIAKNLYGLRLQDFNLMATLVVAIELKNSNLIIVIN